MKCFWFLFIAGVLTMGLYGCSGADSIQHVKDDFDHDKEQWSAWYDPAYPTTHCDSVVDAGFGLLPPSLSLTNKPGQCSGAEILNDLTFENGIIELDVYLLPDALVDLVFRGDLDKNTGYIARLDSRDYHDTFVKIDTWKMLGENSSHSTTANQWHHMRLEVEGSSFTLFCDGQEVARAADSEFGSGQIALMNEVNTVYVDNFKVFSKHGTTTINPKRMLDWNTLTIGGVLVFGLCTGCLILLIGIGIGLSLRKR